MFPVTRCGGGERSAEQMATKSCGVSDACVRTEGHGDRAAALGAESGKYYELCVLLAGCDEITGFVETF